MSGPGEAGAVKKICPHGLTCAVIDVPKHAALFDHVDLGHVSPKAISRQPSLDYPDGYVDLFAAPQPQAPASYYLFVP